MNGFERLKEQVKDGKDLALKQTIEYLLTRDDLEQKFLNEEKNVEEMRKFIKSKGQNCISNGWAYVPDEVIYAWAVMYFSLPNSILKINPNKNKTKNKIDTTSNTVKKDNVVNLEEAKKKVEQKKESDQMSLFGGDIDD